MPLFTLKFSLLVLNKLIKTIWNFNLLQLLIDILFSADEIVYEYSSLYKAALPPFSVRRLLSTEVVAKEDVEETEEFEGIKNFIYSMIRTKDNHFLMMISALISSLMKEIGKDEKIKEKVGFNLKGNGKVVMRIIEILIQQLLQVHRINTILSVVNSILILSSFQVLCEQMHNLYIHTFRKILDETKTAFKTKSQFWDCLIETLEYDLLFVDNYHFDSSNISKKFENVYQIVFSWDVAKQEEENNYFYSSIPETQSQYFRYMYLKFIVLLKGRSILLEGNNHKYNVYLDYISHNNFYKCPYSVGEKKNFEEFNEPLHCEFIENENRIPCVFIPNHTYIIFGYHEKKEGKVKIMIKAKLKHTSAKLITKKNKIYMQIQIRGYDEKMGRLQIKSRHLIRGIESMLQFIVAKQNGIKERQLQFMTNLMKGTSETLP